MLIGSDDLISLTDVVSLSLWQISMDLHGVSVRRKNKEEKVQAEQSNIKAVETLGDT